MSWYAWQDGPCESLSERRERLAHEAYLESGDCEKLDFLTWWDRQREEAFENSI